VLTVLFYYRSGFVESRRLPDWMSRYDLLMECVKLGADAWGGCIGDDDGQSQGRDL
jgi:hypothetical protein